MEGDARRAVWEGTYLDGRVAVRHDVTLTLTRAALHIEGETCGKLTWPYAEIRETQGARAGDPVRLERGAEPAEALVVVERDFLHALRDAAGPLGTGFTDPGRAARRARLVLPVAAACVLAGIAAYLWGVPALASRVASRVPVAWEESLGRSVMDHVLAAGARPCSAPQGVRALETIVRRLSAGAPDARYTFHVTVLDDSLVNAFAAPGGYIVVYRGLLDAAESADELAGVLAHEMQHVLLQHGTRAILREIPLRLVVAAVSGDVRIAGRVSQAAATLGSLRYRRRDEQAADREGLRLLQAARVSPDGMLTFFTRLAGRRDDRASAVMDYLSTHPRSAARAEALRTRAEGTAYEPSPVLDAAGWDALRRVCADAS